MATPTGQARPPMGAWRTRWAAPPRVGYTSETKPFFLTSEFLVFVLYEMGLGIAATTSPTIDARLFWILTTIAASRRRGRAAVRTIPAKTSTSGATASAGRPTNGR